MHRVFLKLIQARATQHRQYVHHKTMPSDISLTCAGGDSKTPTFYSGEEEVSAGGVCSEPSCPFLERRRRVCCRVVSLRRCPPRGQEHNKQASSVFRRKSRRVCARESKVFVALRVPGHDVTLDVTKKKMYWHR